MTVTYFGIVNVALTAGQMTSLTRVLQTLDPLVRAQPIEQNHWRMRLDNDAVIFAADFEPVELTPNAFRQRLADGFGVDISTISASVANVNFSPDGTTQLWTFKYLSTIKLRMALFGGLGATWEQSHAEVLGYLQQYSAQWDGAT